MSPSRNAREPAEVGQGRPQLPGGGHHAGVVLRLGQDDVGPRVHGRARGRGRDGTRRRPGHAERREHLGGDGVVPRGPAHPGDQLAEQAEAEVGVVEPAGGAEDDVVSRRAPRSSSEPPGVRSHQPPGLSAEAPARCESSCPMVRSPNGVPGRCRSSGSSRCSRPSSRSRITTTAVTVLLIDPSRYWTSVCGSAHVAAPGRPGQPAVPDDPGDQARCPALALHAGGAGEQECGRSSAGRVRA